MKVIQANKFYFLKGGAEKYMLEVSDWLTSHSHQVVPFAMEHPDNIKTPYSRLFPSHVFTEKTKPGWQGVRTLSRMVYSIEARRKLATLISENKPDVCHIHNIYTQISPSILHTLRDQRVPVVMTVHDHHLVSPQYNIWAHGCGDDHRDSGVLKATTSRFHKGSFLATFAQTSVHKLHKRMRLYEKNVDLFIAPSAYMKRQLIRGGFSPQKIRVNHYGINARAIEPHFKSDGYFLFVGRLSEEKGVETIIRLAKMLPDIRFKIVGRGPDATHLHRLGHGLNNLQFLGFRVGDELKELHQNAAAVLLPSRVHEVAPLTTLEAMAAGTPVIASDVGGVPEIVSDRSTGFLVKPLDLNSWAEAVMRIAYDDDLRDQMSRASRHRIETHFKTTDHFERLLRIYEEAIAMKKAN